MLAPFIAALMNNARTRKDKKVKATDLFDRKKKKAAQAKKQVTPEERREDQYRAMRQAARLPVPRKLQQRLKERG